MNISLPSVALRNPLKTLWIAIGAAAILAACGGGDGPAMKTSYAIGPINGFGSIIVNGVRYDDSSSSVSSEDDDDNPGRSSSDLKLGMVVQVKAGSISTDASGSQRSSASEIRFGSEIVGPVGTKGTDTFTLLGQTVKVDANTIYDSSSSPPLSGFDQIAENDVLEVYGLLDTAGNAYTATRIERKNNASEYKIRGAIGSLDPDAKTFKIGSETISYASASKLPANLADLQIVRVKLQTEKNAAGAWVATRVKNGMPRMDDTSEAEVKGSVKDLNGRMFTVSGIPVDATNAAIFPANLAEGAFVEVEGSLSGGKLIARKVELEDSSSSTMGSFEFHGKVQFRDVNSITVRDTKLTLVEGSTVFDRGATLANVVTGTCVEVKANASMNATYIKLDNDCL
jgi:Domain of unknown function (DUF5666)